MNNYFYSLVKYSKNLDEYCVGYLVGRDEEGWRGNWNSTKIHDTAGQQRLARLLDKISPLSLANLLVAVERTSGSIKFAPIHYLSANSLEEAYKRLENLIQ